MKTKFYSCWFINPGEAASNSFPFPHVGGTTRAATCQPLVGHCRLIAACVVFWYFTLLAWHPECLDAQAVPPLIMFSRGLACVNVECEVSGTK
jgi:hypothetical protein